MKKTTILLFIMSLCYVSVWADDCDPQPTPPPAGGFKIRAFIEEFAPSEGFYYISDKNRGIRAEWRSDRTGAAGNNRAIVATTDQFGDINVPDGRAPADWFFTETSGPCGGQFLIAGVEKGKIRQLFCNILGAIKDGFTVAPSAVEAESTPETLTLYGAGVSTAYGMPLIRYFDLNGVLVAQAYAEQVGWDGTWLTGSTTDLSSAYSGEYTVIILNANADGTWQSVGGATVEVFHFVEPPPDPDPCGGCGAGGNICSQMPCSVY
jgi:hypothetical protein